MQDVAKRGQIKHVQKRVFKLSLAQRAATPIGTSLVLGRLFIQQLGDQRTICCRILNTYQAGGDLHVEQSCRRTPYGLQTEFYFPASGMDNGLAPWRGNRFPKLSQVFD